MLWSSFHLIKKKTCRHHMQSMFIYIYIVYNTYLGSVTTRVYKFPNPWTLHEASQIYWSVSFQIQTMSFDRGGLDGNFFRVGEYVQYCRYSTSCAWWGLCIYICKWVNWGAWGGCSTGHMSLQNVRSTRLPVHHAARPHTLGHTETYWSAKQNYWVYSRITVC